MEERGCGRENWDDLGLLEGRWEGEGEGRRDVRQREGDGAVVWVPGDSVGIKCYYLRDWIVEKRS